MNLKSKLFVGLGLGLSLSAAAQEVKPVLTGAPFLRITPDARAAGMGDQGVATSTDAFSQFWNAAKYPFSKTTSAVAVNYTPYLSKLTSDVFLLYASYHQFLGQEERSTISASINYFNMGEVELNQLSGTQIVTTGKVKPNEFSVDVAYGLKLSDVYSMAVTGRYIRSDFGTFGDNSTIKPANTFAVDVSGFYQSEKHSSFGDYEGTARAGWAIQNLGPKLDYSGDENSRSYLPTTLRLGAGYDLYLDDMNKVGLSLEASKLLVPGSQLNNSDPANPKYEVPNVGVVEGIGKSFSNKKSVMLSGAVEYSYDDAFAVRGGYFHESDEQGGRRFATVGVGFKYQSFGLDISYLINTSKTNTALDNTLRFGLTWNIGGESSNANN
ncbi:type IX secretion system outer membrane channel protein PorV [Bergeyella cardium]|uniref:type IX secretion system outer membrane channel protein PorV n=1 Tax=Bergeyella cardium TaxID=1585976 RepID=UPI0024A9F386|nr:type IX secretion system outer membrane channel protein PorV [Bergeyella cardium]WHF59984.1 type IX secretion system outer membrane channel protein PorV [Bergeyella cardium]